MSLWVAQPNFGGGRPLPGQALASLAARDATAHAHARAGRIRRPRLAQHVGGALGGAHSRLYVDLSTLSKDGHSMFAGGVQQRKALGDTKRTGEHIGPGTYDLRGHTIHGRMVSSTNPRLPGFASSAPRADDYEYDD